MSEETEFDFTDSELFAAFRLVTSEQEARQQVDSVRVVFKPGMDWAASHQLLVLLSVASPTGREKVERIRKAEQHARIRTSLRQEMGNVPDAELNSRLRDALAEEDRRWEAERAEFLRVLRERGHLPDQSP